MRNPGRAARPLGRPKAEPSGPMQGLFGLFQHEAQAQPVNPNRVESKVCRRPALPRPMASRRRPQMGHQTGHQFGAQRAAGRAPVPIQRSDAIRPPGAIGAGPGVAPPPVPAETVMTLPPDDQPEQGQPKELPPNLKRQLVDFTTKEPAGTIIVDTANTYLYLVLGGGKALRYGVARRPRRLHLDRHRARLAR